jgi:hypothetical protein
MLNNAIEHSRTAAVLIQAALRGGKLSFTVEDFGIGAFRNIMKTRELRSETEAIQDLLKGKTTTMPRSHSGEGIFFTSRCADVFLLESFGSELKISRAGAGIEVRRPSRSKRGTQVFFEISSKSKLRLNGIFKKYANIGADSNYGFDRTEIRVRLFTMGGVHVSRSQARRILSGLEKFRVIALDFDQVPMVGQAFADEIYRVFRNRHPEITVREENMSAGVRFMVERAKGEARKKL